MLEDWQPTAKLGTLRLRAHLLANIRDFFHRRGILEVETPLLSQAATTDPNIESLVTHYVGPGFPKGADFYLHTSPEFAMKRLLAANSGPIYQIGKVFRQGEKGRFHNPEFTLLEWYRPGFSYRELMGEVRALVEEILKQYMPMPQSEELTYNEAFQQYAGIDAHQATPQDLINCMAQHGIKDVPGLSLQDRDGILNLILSHVVEPHLGINKLTFIYDYPATQAALARIRPGPPKVAERFELYINGMEIANGFHELGDSDEQQHRFANDLGKRRSAELRQVPMDERLLAALNYGLPDCSGVALGIDRLCMIAAGVDNIQDVISFPITIA